VSAGYTAAAASLDTVVREVVPRPKHRSGSGKGLLLGWGGDAQLSHDLPITVENSGEHMSDLVALVLGLSEPLEILAVVARHVDRLQSHEHRSEREPEGKKGHDDTTVPSERLSK
jgi:hypothetical protein